MADFFLRIYDYLSARRAAAWIILAAVTALLALGASKISFGEDVADFLPQDERNARYAKAAGISSGQSEIAVIFKAAEPGSESYLTEAIDRFAELWKADSALAEYPLRSRADLKAIARAARFIEENFPLFLSEADYARADSLLAADDYMSLRAGILKENLGKPAAAFSSGYLRSDPLLLFSPAMQKLQKLSAGGRFKTYDGYLTDEDGLHGFAFITSPHGGSETDRNHDLSLAIERVIAEASEGLENIEISAVGAPLIAVENSRCIKDDSFRSMMIAGALILLLLFWALRRPDYILWTGFATAFGFMAALTAMYLFKGGMSVIVLGICSVIAGIAVNYPLHYLSHLRHCPDRREALRQTVVPLTVGNITTVSAFFCLIFVDAPAMRDLGLFASAALIASLLFSVTLLPSVCAAPKKAAEEAKAARKEDARGHLFSPFRPGSRGSKIFFGAYCLATAVLLFFSRSNSFDSDLSNINYMTERQRSDLALLSELRDEQKGEAAVYVVASAGDVQSALENGERAMAAADSLLDGGMVRTAGGPCGLLPSMKSQAGAIARWRQFLDEHPALSADFRLACERTGLKPGIFGAFFGLMEKDFKPREAEYFEPLTSLMPRGYVIQDGGSETLIVSQLRTPKEKSAEVKQTLNAVLGEGGFAFEQADAAAGLVQSLSDELDYIGYVCAAVVFVFLLLSFGSAEISLMAFAPLAAAWVWILGLMNIFDVKFNIVNIILATFIFGQGDDYAIFITEGLMHEYACGRKILHSYSSGIMLSAGIMFAGVGILAFAEHPAMRSLGLVASIGMAAVVFSAFYLTPLIFRLLTRKKGRLRRYPLTLKRLLRSLFALIFFALTAFLAAKPYVFFRFTLGRTSEKKRERLHVLMFRFFRFVSTRVPGVRFSLSNPGGETFEKPAVIICNHQSHLDLACLLALSPKLVILTNDWVWRNPFYGSIIRHAEFYPVSDGIEANLGRLSGLAKRGYSVVIFPEGTRTPDGEIGRFHPGAFHIARELGLDILPVMIHGAWDVLPKNDFMLCEGTISLEIGGRIPCEELSKGTSLRLSQEFYHRYSQAYAALRREREKSSYFISYIRGAYRYKGREIEGLCKEELAKIRRGADLIDAPRAAGGSAMIDNCACGAFALAFALVNKDTAVTARIADSEMLAAARNLAALPPNLSFTDELCDAGEIIDLARL